MIELKLETNDGVLQNIDDESDFSERPTPTRKKTTFSFFNTFEYRFCINKQSARESKIKATLTIVVIDEVYATTGTRNDGRERSKSRRCPRAVP